MREGWPDISDGGSQWIEGWGGNGVKANTTV